jgi:hypothetical protein
MHLFGMMGHQVESDEGTDAGTKHQRRFGGERGQQAMGVVTVRLQAWGFKGLIELAARQAPTIVGDDRVVVDEMVGETVGAIGISISALEYEQEWA